MSRAALELNLPDLPEVPIQLGTDASPLRRPRLPWPARLRDALTAYLPLLMMVALAGGTWWLVEHSPKPGAPRPSASTRSEPDYTMRGFSVQRYNRDGALAARIEGRQLHHYPDSDRIEIEEIHLTVFHLDGRRTQATARKAVANGKANHLQLQGGAQLRASTPEGLAVAIDSEFLEFFTETEQVRTDRPVRASVGRDLVSAAGLRYDNRTRRLELNPPVRAVLNPRGQAAE